MLGRVKTMIRTLPISATQTIRSVVQQIAGFRLYTHDEYYLPPVFLAGRSRTIRLDPVADVLRGPDRPPGDFLKGPALFEIGSSLGREVRDIPFGHGRRLGHPFRLGLLLDDLCIAQ